MSDKHINRLFEALTPNTEHKEKMFQNLLVQSQNENKKQREFTPVKRWRPAILCAILIGCLTSTALAAAYMGLDEAFLKFLKPLNQEQAQYLSNGAYVINKQVENENGTLTIKQAIGDSNTTYILMDFTAPKGTVLNAAGYRFEVPHITYDGAGRDKFSRSYGFKVLDDGNPNDNKISLIMSIGTDNSIAGKTFDFSVENLQAINPLTKNFETVIPGYWGTMLKLDFKDTSSLYQIDQDITLYGYKAVLKTISISPISITLKTGSNYLKEIFNYTLSLEKKVGKDESGHFPITINYKDGTSNLLNGSINMDFIEGEMITTYSFGNVINDKEITSVVFFDKEFPIKD
ncbi:DUF4179 domain-containing protein [Paenibacillus ehimensis]|uniref:DUF4179 domain-containing protein n=1 Tax=Paenibacillus ehimensis TaxID=79264 RepID=A0ABT8VK41_9BACL|nr:DUF4179 domain-containing protein [Paenibacillus ehimensis]MDO3681339.1 DUF4179 domain-containing protein [Paenibacillus ehimensis]MEC0207817.1 DUF4179 domain-containing protein [Paenibacillus ehimensis]